MAADGMALIRRLYEIGDRGDLDGFAELLHPDVEWHTAREAPDPDVHRGREGAKDVLRNFHEYFADVRHELEDVVVVGSEIVVTCRVRARARTSGVVVDERRAHTWTMDGGRPRRIRSYLDPEHALREAREAQPGRPEESAAAQVVREFAAAYAREDWPKTLRLLHPAYELSMEGRHPDAGTYRGREGAREFFRRWLGAFENRTWEVEAIVPASGSRVLVLGRERLRGKGSGIELEQATAVLHTVAGGKIVRSRIYLEREEALRAAGIDPGNPTGL